MTMPTVSMLTGMRMRPGQLLDADIPPSLISDEAIRGRRPCMVVGEDPTLGLLVVPITTGGAKVNQGKLWLDEGGLYGHARTDSLRWISRSAIRGLPRCSALRRGTIRAVLEDARETLVAIGQRDLYRAAKRDIN